MPDLVKVVVATEEISASILDVVSAAPLSLIMLWVLIYVLFLFTIKLTDLIILVDGSASIPLMVTVKLFFHTMTRTIWSVIRNGFSNDSALDNTLTQAHGFNGVPIGIVSLGSWPRRALFSRIIIVVWIGSSQMNLEFVFVLEAGAIRELCYLLMIAKGSGWEREWWF